MTAIDTSTEAVERLANHIKSTCGCALGSDAEQPVAETLRSLLKERDDLRTKLDAAVEALKHYRETLCEGFCKGDVWADEGHSHPDIQRDCGGCLAASVLINCAALAQIKGDDQ